MGLSAASIPGHPNLQQPAQSLWPGLAGTAGLAHTLMRVSIMQIAVLDVHCIAQLLEQLTQQDGDRDAGTTP